MLFACKSLDSLKPKIVKANTIRRFHKRISRFPKFRKKKITITIVTYVFYGRRVHPVIVEFNRKLAFVLHLLGTYLKKKNLSYLPGHMTVKVCQGRG